MNIYLTILKVIYVIIAVIIAVFIGWTVVKDKKVTAKLIGAIALMMFVLRIFMIK